MKLQYILGFSVLLSALTACDSSSSSSTAPTPTVQGNVTPPTTVTPVLPVGPGTPGNGEGEAPVDGGTIDTGLTAGLQLTQAQFLTNLGSGIASRTSEFRQASEALNSSVNAYCGSYDAVQLEDLKLRFRDAMMVWQNLELFQMGPLAANAGALKYKIYGWPLLANYCKIDEEAIIALGEPSYTVPSYTNRKGLQALEYLIFDSTLTSICPRTNPTKAEWEALDAQQKWQARCAYMKPVAAELVGNAVALESQWGTKDDNYASRSLATPTASQGVLQELFNNLFYMDLEVKNQKLAAPAGQDVLYCNKTPNVCPDKDELHYSRLSKEAMTENVRALTDIIFGFGKPRDGGLSALVRSSNGAVAANASEVNVSKLYNLVESQKASLEELLAAKQAENCEATQFSWVCRLRQSIKDISSDFKSEYATILNLQVPVAPQGDND